MSRRGAHAAYAGLTDVGLSRSHNEDAFVTRPPLFAIADGLGGHRAGEVASALAIETLLDEAPSSTDASVLAHAVVAANREIMSAIREGRGRPGMGTTLTAAIVRGTRVVVAQVGDSRAYLLRDDRLVRVTRDHSLVAEMVRRGTITEEEARFHPDRSVITRALGSQPDVEADTYEIATEPGDRLLLCSDGLHSMITDQEIEAILASAQDAEAAVRALVDAANDAGGLDNVTAVVVEIGTAGAPPVAPPRGRGLAAGLLWVVAALLVIAAGAFGSYSYARNRAYVIAEEDRVAVYRGVPGSFAGVSLHWLEQLTAVAVDDLPLVTAERLRDGIRVEDLHAAMALVSEYRDLVSETATPAGAP